MNPSIPESGGPLNLLPHAIKPMHIRHAEDSAFYWMQRDGNSGSPLLRFERLVHFDQLLNAHLDGLREAGEPGWEIALKNLTRWKTNGESFTAWVLMLESNNREKLNTLWRLVKTCPDTTYSGLVSALGWVAPGVALPWLEYWLNQTEFGGLQMIALRGYAIRRIVPNTPLDSFFRSPHAFVRAAACMLAGRVRMYGCNAYLHALRQDPDADVRACAALALHLQGEGVAVATDMWQALQHLNLTANSAGGLARQQGFERCITYARHFGHALPANHFDWPQVAQMLPPRQAITLFAHHGDPATIPLIAPFLANPELARLAGWAISMITGIDLDAHNLTQPAPEPDEDERTSPSDPDLGLPWPNPAAISAWWNTQRFSYQAGQRLLSGQSINDKEHCLDVLDYGTQAERYAAALNLALADRQFPFIETRAMAEQQQRLLNQIQIK
jgi:uncharacterized protein (TIGR02270 family)